MKFYDRKPELAILRQNRKQSETVACFTVMVGRRRIGKTSLLLESVKGKRYLYLFISRRSEALLCAQFQKEAKVALGLEIFGTITSFRDLFEQLLIYAEKKHFTLIIDEFQEFEYVNPAIFSDIQLLWDIYKSKAKINLIACGSIYSLMMRIFENMKEPLFGRLTSKIILQPFTVNVMKEILKDFAPRYSPEDLLYMYMLTGGVAKYIALLMDAGAVNADSMLDAAIRPDSPFLGEGKDLLISEFGREYGTYFSILQLIAAGKTSQSEIDSIIGKNTGAYLLNLERDYSLIARKKPMFSKPESRNTRWGINDNYLRFWFRFIFPNQLLIETGRHELLREYIGKNYEQYSGMLLEKYFREKLVQSERITDIGSYWDRKGENEIDLIALSKLDKTAIIAEVKRNPHKLNIPLLQAKASRLGKELTGYAIQLKGFSLKDM